MATVVFGAALLIVWYLRDLVLVLHPAKVLGVALLVLLAASAGMLIDFVRPRHTSAGAIPAKPLRQGLEVHEFRQQLIDALPTLIWSTDPDGTVTFLNRRWLDYTGLTREDAVAGGWVEIIHPEDRNRLVSFWQALLAKGVPGEVEARMLRADGQYRWFLFRGEPIRDACGQTVQWFGSNTDIHDIRMAERELRRAEERLRKIIDTIPVCVTVAFPDGKVEFINASWIEDGFSEADHRAGPERLIHPEDLPRFLEKFRSSIATGEPYETEVRLRKADGSYRWYLVRCVVAKDEGGQAWRRYSTGIDIHDRKEMEDTLRAHGRELQLILDTIPAYVWGLQPNGEPDFINRPMSLFYFGEVRDIDRSEPETGTRLERSVQRLMHPEDVPVIRAILGHSLETGEPFAMRFRKRRADGEYRWVSARAEPLRDAEGHIVKWYGVTTDIHDEVKAQENLRAAQRRLSRSAQLASLAELSAAIAHEVNQPLAAIVSNSQACRRWLSVEPPDVDRIRCIIDRIIRDANSAASVVTGVRALYANETTARSWIDVNEVVEEARQMLADDLSRNSVAFRTDLAPALPQVFADRVQIQQVLVNLIRNGIEAMRANLDDPKVMLVRSILEDGAIRIEVADSGTGIKELDRIFEPMFTTKARGMGMGLAVSRSILQAHGGTISAGNANPRGAVFSFTLPVRRSVA
jgi:hypothetical protein